VNFRRLALPKRRRLANVAVILYLQVLVSDVRRVESVVEPRLVCTDTRPVQPVAAVTPAGRVSAPETTKRNGAPRSDAGVTFALSSAPAGGRRSAPAAREPVAGRAAAAAGPAAVAVAVAAPRCTRMRCRR